MIKKLKKQLISFESLECRVLLTQSLSLNVSTSVANYGEGDSDDASLIKSHVTSLSGSANAESTYDNSSGHLLSRLDASASGDENVAGSSRSGTFSIAYDARRVSTVVGDPARIRTAFNSSIEWGLDATGAEDLGYSYEVTLDVASSGEGPFRGDSTPLQLGLPNGQIVRVEGAGSTTYKGELSPATNRPAPLGFGAGLLRQDAGGIVDTQGQVSVTITYKIIYKLQADLAVDGSPSTLAYDPGTNRLVVNYEVRGVALPSPAEYSLDWVDKDGKKIATAYAGATDTAVGGHTLSIDPGSLSAAPAGAAKLRLVLDPSDKLVESDEGNNQTEMTVSDLVATSLQFDAQGVTFGYDVLKNSLPGGTTVALYWASGDTFATAIGGPIHSVAAQQAVGSYGPVHVDASALGTPPQAATRLLLVADPPSAGNPIGSVFETNEGNNAQAVVIPRPDIALTSLTRDPSGGVDLGYAISGFSLPTVTTVALYWARGTTFDTKIGGPITSTATQSAVGTYGPVHVDAAKLGTPPRGAQYLLAVADPDDQITESDESNNVQAVAIPLPDIALTSLTRSADGGADIRYTVASGPLPADTTVALYWTGGTTLASKIGGPISSTPAQKATGSYGPVHVDAAKLATPPPGAKYLLAAADPDDKVAESDESNNVRFVEIRRPDIAVQKGGLDWNSYRGAGINDPERGVDLSYQILNADLGARPEVAFYWADASKAKIGDRLPLDPSTILVTQQGPRQVNEPARWGPAPPNARYVVAVLDPDHMIDESNETNNEVYLPVHTKAVILDGAVQPRVAGGTKLVASFVPGQGSPDGPLTLSEAEVVLGMDHFNWVQTIRVPSNMQLQIWRNVTQTNLVNGRPSDGELIATPAPAYDPVPSGGDDRYFLRVDGNKLGDVLYWPINYSNPDSVEPYLQEIPAEWKILDIPGGTQSSVEFDFIDQPSLPAKFFLFTNSFLTFETRLVGMSPSGDWSSFNQPRTEFTWKFNSYHGPTRLGYLAGRPADAPPILDGGVFDVRYDDGTLVPGIPTAPPRFVTPTVRSFVVNDGTAQRSIVKSLTVTFGGPVTFDPGAFEVRSRDGRSVGLNVASSLVDGKNVVVLTFTGSQVTRGSLPNGRYTLTVHGDKVHDPQGQALDGDRDGVPRGDYVAGFQAAGVLNPPTVTPSPASGFGVGRDAFVSRLYRDDLGRSPEPSGLRFWSGVLASGVKPKTVALAIWRSPEHRTLVNQHMIPPITFQRSYADALLAGRMAARSHVSTPAGPLLLRRT